MSSFLLPFGPPKQATTLFLGLAVPASDVLRDLLSAMCTRYHTLLLRTVCLPLLLAGFVHAMRAVRAILVSQGLVLLIFKASQAAPRALARHPGVATSEQHVQATARYGRLVA